MSEDKMPTLSRKFVTVELANGDLLSARVINPDTIRYEMEAKRRGWPTMTIEDGVAHMQGLAQRNTFESWAALKRTGQYAGDFDTFANSDCIDIAVEEVEVDPTRQAVGSDSAPNLPGTDADPSQSSSQQTTTS